MNKSIFSNYLLCAILLSFYGAFVCPFLESLSLLSLTLPILIAYTLGFFYRVYKQKTILKLSLEKQSAEIFKIEIKIFLSLGISLMFFNFFYFSFPLESGLKVVFGTFLLGIFLALYLSLQNDKLVINTLIKENKNISLNSDYISLPKKFIFMSLLMIGSISSVLLMLVSKDLDWFHEKGIYLDFFTAKLSILTEITFVILIILFFSIRIILLFSSNLNTLLLNQNRVLKEVSNGNLNTCVPVISSDEFGFMAQGTNQMIFDLKQNEEEIKKTRDVIILSMADLAEKRDNETGAHIIRTQKYVKALAKKLQEDPIFSSFLSDENIELLYKSAPLHDIGKVGIPDNILCKPGKLTFEEFEIMKTHALIGADAINNTKGALKNDAFLNFAHEIALCHHEKYDGSGYPNALKKEEIPLSARIMALADVYDALISKRVYKDGFTHEKAKEIICEGSGSHFDPKIVKAFLDIEDEFLAIKQAHS